MHGRKEQVRFYVDGMPATERQETHTERDQARQKALIKADTALSNLESRLTRNDASVNTMSAAPASTCGRHFIGLSSIFTALAILSDNDYVGNILHLAFETNLKTIKGMEEEQYHSQYLDHDQVKLQMDKANTDWTEHSYADAVKVFVNFQEDVVPLDSTVTTPDDHPTVSAHVPAKDDATKDATVTYAAVSKRMDRFNVAFEAYKKEESEARAATRTACDAQPEPRTAPKLANPFATIGRPDPAHNLQYRPRFSPRIRYEPAVERPGPTISKKYKLKSWKKPLLDVDQLSKNVRTVVKNELDRLSSSVHYASDSDLVTKNIVDCIRSAVKQLFGLYLDDLFYPPPTPGAPQPAVPVAEINQQDHAVLDNVCPRFSSNEMSGDNNNVSPAEGGQDDESNAPFIHSFLSFLYSDNLPGNGKTGSAVNTFIGQLQDMGHLEKSEQKRAEMLKNIKEYTPNFVVRSVASQLSVVSMNAIPSRSAPRAGTLSARRRASGASLAATSAGRNKRRAKEGAPVDQDTDAQSTDGAAASRGGCSRGKRKAKESGAADKEAPPKRVKRPVVKSTFPVHQ
ncbi:hypothetical protein BGZ47_002576 [Haplosporangium gracile]|nr:hypothetical protein BGZ47_002576 [Haplosporangium gracile]